MRRRGETPAEPGNYQLPFVVTTAAQAVRLAAYVEERVCAAYVELAADTDPGLQRLAVLATQECAVRGFGWQPEIVAFPGLPGQVKTPSSPAARPAPAPAPGVRGAGRPAGDLVIVGAVDASGPRGRLNPPGPGDLGRPTTPVYSRFFG